MPVSPPPGTDPRSIRPELNRKGAAARLAVEAIRQNGNCRRSAIRRRRHDDMIARWLAASKTRMMPDQDMDDMQELEQAYATILSLIGEDPGRDGLRKTPGRAAEALRFLMRGYGQNVAEVVNDALYPSATDEMVIVKNIEMYSMCEHHLLPFIGKCHVAYVPDGKVLGLSKIARIVDVFARRLQIQENLTQQIANSIQQITGAKGVAVIVEAQHMCMMMRGVEKQNSVMTTSCMLGAFRARATTRTEFLSLIR